VAGALAIGALVFWLVFSPMLFRSQEQPMPPEPVADDETRSGIALLALREIELDRATGKLSDDDYAALKERYSAEALAALDRDQAEEARVAATADPEALVAARLSQLRTAHAAGAPAPPLCPGCGPRPEPDALFCSSCGRALAEPGFCAACGQRLAADSRFCPGCGNKVAA
jgi:double zinc ribbon protein